MGMRGGDGEIDIGDFPKINEFRYCKILRFTANYDAAAHNVLPHFKN